MRGYALICECRDMEAMILNIWHENPPSVRQLVSDGDLTDNEAMELLKSDCIEVCDGSLVYTVTLAEVDIKIGEGGRD